MKPYKWVASLFIFFLILSVGQMPTYAQEEPAFWYELCVDGKDTVEVHTGDVMTVTLTLHRTDSDAPFTVYGMQDEIRYDSEFFELVEDSVTLTEGVDSADVALGGGWRELYMTFLSFTGGTQWQPKQRIGSFMLRVKATEGMSTVTNEDFLVSLPDGSGSYACQANALTVIVNTNCLVKFESNGGTTVDPVSVVYGEKLARPTDPEREGMRFAGWFQDFRLTQPWDFENDTVQGNMRLYAKWEEAQTEPPTTQPPETEPTETESSATQTQPILPESAPDTQTVPSESGTEPGNAEQPTEQTYCPICGKNTNGFLCTTCSLFLYLAILLALGAVLATGVAVYFKAVKGKPDQESTDKDKNAEK